MIFMKHADLMLVLWLCLLGATGPLTARGQAAEADPQTQKLLAAAEAGDAGAQYLLGYMYAEGQGVDQNVKEALRWYIRAAEQGHADAQLSAAMIYAEGRGVVPDEKQAIYWYRRAAEQGNATVQVMLATLLANAGSRQQLIEAYQWLLLAEAGGKDVADHKALLEPRLSDKQIAEAQRRAENVGRPPDPDGPVQYIAEEEGYALAFPAPPERTVVQDNDRLLAIHYRSMPAGGPVQYNASFQYFKTQKILGDAAQAAFIADYLLGRAMFAWQNRIQKKEMRFRGFNAAAYKHTTFAGSTETIHEGLIFLMNGDAVTLTCVYPADVVPNPTFNAFIGAFERLDPPADPNTLPDAAPNP
jgi:hypothetical protein